MTSPAYVVRTTLLFSVCCLISCQTPIAKEHTTETNFHSRSETSIDVRKIPTTRHDIRVIKISPSPTSTLAMGEALYITYEFNVSEQHCQIWMTPESPKDYRESYGQHGLMLTHSMSPVFAYGHGTVLQSIWMNYNREIDHKYEHGPLYKEELVVTNITVRLRDCATEKEGTITNIPVHVTLKCRKD